MFLMNDLLYLHDKIIKKKKKLLRSNDIYTNPNVM